MKDFLRDPLNQRVFLTILSVGAFVLSALFPAVRSELIGVAGVLFGWARLNKPGYVNEDTVNMVVKKASLHPPAKMFPSSIPVRMEEEDLK